MRVSPTVFTLVIVLSAGPASATSVLANGDAETGDLTGWTLDISAATSGLSPIIDAVTEQDQLTGIVQERSGDFFFSFATQEAAATFDSGITISMSQTGTLGLTSPRVLLSGWYQNEIVDGVSDTAEAKLTVFDSGGSSLVSQTTGLLTSAQNFQWKPFSLEMDLTPLSGNAASWEVELLGTVEFGVFVNTFYDDVSLQPIPEPSTMLTSSGLFVVGLIGHRWRRRKFLRELVR